MRKSIKNIKKLVSVGDTENSLELLSRLSNDYDDISFQKTIQLLKGRFQRTRTDFENGIVSYEDYQIELRRIDNLILDKVNSINKGKPSLQPNLNWPLIISVFLIVSLFFILLKEYTKESNTRNSEGIELMKIRAEETISEFDLFNSEMDSLINMYISTPLPQKEILNDANLPTDSNNPIIQELTSIKRNFSNAKEEFKSLNTLRIESAKKNEIIKFDGLSRMIDEIEYKHELDKAIPRLEIFEKLPTLLTPVQL